MNKFVLFTVVLLAALTAKASVYPFVLIKCSDGSQTFLKTDVLGFKVADGKLSAENADGTTVFLFSNLVSMSFVETSGISAVSAEGSEVEVFNVSGISLGLFPSVDTFRASIALPGVYIVKNSVSTEKIVIRK